MMMMVMMMVVVIKTKKHTVPMPCFSILLINSLSVSKSGGFVNFSASFIFQINEENSITMHYNISKYSFCINHKNWQLLMEESIGDSTKLKNERQAK